MPFHKFDVVSIELCIQRRSKMSYKKWIICHQNDTDVSICRMNQEGVVSTFKNFIYIGGRKSICGFNDSHHQLINIQWYLLLREVVHFQRVPIIIMIVIIILTVLYVIIMKGGRNLSYRLNDSHVLNDNILFRCDLICTSELHDEDN